MRPQTYPRLRLHFSASDTYEIGPKEPEKVAGRADNCDIDFKKHFSNVRHTSRYQFIIFYDQREGNFCIRDHPQSTFKTLLNGLRVEERGRVLKNGFEIQPAGEKEMTITVEIVEGTITPVRPIQGEPARKYLLSRLQAEQDIVLLGTAGMGKTTLLTELEQGADFQYYLPDHRLLLFCYINCETIKNNLSLVNFARLLISTTKPAFCQSYLKRWPAEVREAFELLEDSASIEKIKIALQQTIMAVDKQLKKRVVFLLDQFDDICYQLPPGLFAILKGLKPRVLYIIAMQNEFNKAREGVDQFTRVLSPGHKYWMPLLTEEQLNQITRDCPVEIVRHLGGRQPRLTQLVVEAMRRQQPLPFRDESEWVKELFHNQDIHQHCQRIWRSLLLAEKRALRSLVGKRARIDKITQDRLENEKHLIVSDEKERLFFSTPLFEAFIRKTELEPPILWFDEAAEKFSVEDEIIPPQHFTAREENLLIMLSRQRGQTCELDDIWEIVFSEFYQAGEGIGDNMIQGLVKDLRKKLDHLIFPGCGKIYIETVPKRGYKASETHIKKFNR